jgi:hypothetical protein
MLHQKLHLQHHRHTGRLIHHSHTSYRSLFGILLLAGACMLGISYMQHAAADELMSVTVSVHVPVPHTPAVIAKPLDSAVIPSGDTMIIGSCPMVAPQPLIVITVDGKAAGSASCNTTNDFSFSTNLAAGAHEIIAIPYTVDDDQGPASVPVHIRSQGVATAAASPAVTLTPSAPFIRVNDDKTVTWSGTLNGTKPSYQLVMEWGDGTYDSYTVKPGPQQLRHCYTLAASYNITVSYRDDAGLSHYQQSAATTSDTAVLAALQSASTSDQSNISGIGPIFGLYGLFVTVVCVTAIIRLHASKFAYAPIRMSHHAS